MYVSFKNIFDFIILKDSILRLQKGLPILERRVYLHIANNQNKYGSGC